MSKNEKDVMVVLPNAGDKRYLTKMISEEYKLHWIDVEIFASRESQIRRTRTTGVWLAKFELFGSDFVQMCERADYLREKMLKQTKLSPKPPKKK